MTRSWSFSTCSLRCTRHRGGVTLSVQTHSRMLRYRGCTSAFRQLPHPKTSARSLHFAMPPRKSVQQQQAAARSDGRTAIDLSNAEVARRLAAPSSFPRREPLPAWAVPSSSGNVGSARGFASTTASKSSSTSSQSKQKPEAQDADQMARRLTRFYTSNFERRPVITLCVTNSILSTIGDTCAQLIPILALVGGTDVPGWDFARTLRFAVFGFSLGPMIEKWNRFLEYRFPLRPVEQVFAEKKPEMPDPDSPAFMDGLKKMAEKEGFKVNVERGDSQQGQQYASHGLRVPQDGPHRRSSSRAQPSGEKGGNAEFIIDPQHVAMPNTGQPGQISVAALFKRVAADQLFMAPLGLAVFISTMAVLEGLEWDDVVDRYKKLYLPILLINWQIWPIVQLINFRYLPLRYRVPFSASLGVLWTVFLSFRQAKATKA